MLGRVIKLAALAGVGALAWRWWRNMQAENREYSTGSDSPIGESAEQVPAQ